MERNFTDENFERFLRQNADGLRMRPSDKVWASINNRLNRRRRRFGFLLAFSLLSLTGLGYYLSTTGNNVAAVRNSQSSHLVSLMPSSSGKGTGISTEGRPSDNHTAFSSSALSQPQTAPANRNGHSAPARRNTGAYASVLVNEPSDLYGNTLLSGVPAETFIPTIVDSYSEDLAATENKTAPAANKPAAYPLTIESVVNSYRPRTGKLGLQFYFTPTFSYRKLHDNNISNVVTHKPDFGFQIGLSAKYPISRHVKVVGGLQFNVNRYDIKTYNSTPQYATIRLRNGMDSLNAATSYNNFGGYKSNWLENFFFQVSAPVGMEVTVKSNTRTRFGIATTVQPTYIIGDRAYLLSSDYKNYAEVPRLISHWNVNTSFETFVAYGTGRLKWQVGPQVRYQIFSTYDRKYPVKENLFDFGLKVGISLNNR